MYYVLDVAVVEHCGFTGIERCTEKVIGEVEENRPIHKIQQQVKITLIFFVRCFASNRCGRNFLLFPASLLLLLIHIVELVQAHDVGECVCISLGSLYTHLLFRLFVFRFHSINFRRTDFSSLTYLAGLEMHAGQNWCIIFIL